jgi:hypothetical protein
MNGCAFWDMTPCNQLIISQSFSRTQGTYFSGEAESDIKEIAFLVARLASSH